MANVTHHGLQPNEDPFDRVTGIVSSISTTFSRPYAMLYASMRLMPGEEYAYRYHSQLFWLYRVMLNGVARSKEAVSQLKGKSVHEILNEVPRIKRGKLGGKLDRRVEKFTHSGRSPEGTFSTRTDIEGNYPILFGISEGAFTPSPTAIYLKSHEKRSQEPIAFGSLTHIEVPLESVDETKRFLAERGKSLPVIPIEFGELLSREFTPAQLVSGNPFRAVK